MNLRQKIEENKKILAVSTGLVLTMLLITPLLANELLVDDQRLAFNASADVSTSYNNSTNRVGFAPGSKALDYGKLNTESNATRFISLNAPQETTFNYEAQGNISEYLNYEKQMVFEGRKNISVELIPERPGNFSGQFIVKAKYPNGGLGERWMELRR